MTHFNEEFETADVALCELSKKVPIKFLCRAVLPTSLWSGSKLDAQVGRP